MVKNKITRKTHKKQNGKSKKISMTNSTSTEKVKSRTTDNNQVEFTTNNESVKKIKGTLLDNAQYMSLLLKPETDKQKNVASVLGQINTSKGQKYQLFIHGQASVTDYKGNLITEASVLADFLNENKENALNYDSNAYVAVEGTAPSGKKYVGVFYSIKDAESYISKKHQKGEL